jgi:hypothetical protein
MNETEWMTCTNPWQMLVFLEPRANNRNEQLFAVACCRRALSVGADPRHHELLDAAERFADGLQSKEEFERVRDAVMELSADYPEDDPWNPSRFLTAATLHARGGGSAKWAADFAAKGLACLAGEQDSEPWLSALSAERSCQSVLLRDIFGYPFRPLQFDPVWLSDEGRDAQRLARKLYDAGRYEDLSRLADVLERAGCDNPIVLDHCRAPGLHVRGCWVLDGLIGRASAVHSGLLTEADWRACQDQASLLHLLRDKGTDRKWRLFAVACCRRIDHWITDGRSRRAIEVAARYTEGTASGEALEEARAAAQEAQEEAEHAEWVAEAEENFCLTPRHAAISRSLFAARAARSAVCRDPRATDAQTGTHEAEYWRPSHEWAIAAVRWDVYAQMREDDEAPDTAMDDPFDTSLIMTEHGKLSSRPPGAMVKEAADSAGQSELRAQCEIVHDLFGELLGPPGDEGAWFPSGEAGPRSEWWCLLPVPRRVVVQPEWIEWSEGTIPKLVREIYAEDGFDHLYPLADALEKAGCDEPTILGHLRGGGPHVRGCWVLEMLIGRELP